jgi:hypothetical protein
VTPVLCNNIYDLLYYMRAGGIKNKPRFHCFLTHDHIWYTRVFFFQRSLYCKWNPQFYVLNHVTCAQSLDSKWSPQFWVPLQVTVIVMCVGFSFGLGFQTVARHMSKLDLTLQRVAPFMRGMWPYGTPCAQHLRLWGL